MAGTNCRSLPFLVLQRVVRHQHREGARKFADRRQVEEEGRQQQTFPNGFRRRLPWLRF